MASESPRGSEQWRNEKAALQRKLDHCLEGMADHEFAGEDDLVKAARELCDIYSDGDFRHRYSNIAEIIERPEFGQTADDAMKERLEKLNAVIQAEQARASCLTANLRMLITYNPEGRFKIKDDGPILGIQQDRRLEKLYDHVSLEAKRSGYNAGSICMMLEELNEAKEQLKTTKEEIAEADDRLSDTKKQVRKAKKAADGAKEKAVSLQRETIAILGIFSAVTLAFNAGVSFTTSSLSELNAVSPNIFQIAFVVGVVGFFLFNILYAAFSFIHRLVSEKKGKGARRFFPPVALLLVELAMAAFIVIFCLLAMGWIHP